ncbi:atherin [Mastomys coucha]|uniref:atherin n=1 Tax=Mastomys coucha TaxID=35658 RepID=UPI0012628317|nr:atherin [Mastomys coucha]
MRVSPAEVGPPSRTRLLRTAGARAGGPPPEAPAAGNSRRAPRPPRPGASRDTPPRRPEPRARPLPQEAAAPRRPPCAAPAPRAARRPWLPRAIRSLPSPPPSARATYLPRPHQRRLTPLHFRLPAPALGPGHVGARGHLTRKRLAGARRCGPPRPGRRAFGPLSAGWRGLSRLRPSGRIK